jgi:hypothetical protein
VAITAGVAVIISEAVVTAEGTYPLGEPAGSAAMVAITHSGFVAAAAASAVRG